MLLENVGIADAALLVALDRGIGEHDVEVAHAELVRDAVLRAVRLRDAQVLQALDGRQHLGGDVGAGRTSLVREIGAAAHARVDLRVEGRCRAREEQLVEVVAHQRAVGRAERLLGRDQGARLVGDHLARGGARVVAGAVAHAAPGRHELADRAGLAGVERRLDAGDRGQHLLAVGVAVRGLAPEVVAAMEAEVVEHLGELATAQRLVEACGAQARDGPLALRRLEPFGTRALGYEPVCTQDGQHGLCAVLRAALVDPGVVEGAALARERHLGLRVEGRVETMDAHAEDLVAVRIDHRPSDMVDIGSKAQDEALGALRVVLGHIHSSPSVVWFVNRLRCARHSPRSNTVPGATWIRTSSPARNSSSL